MTEARLKTGLWVSAALRTAAQGGRSAMRLRRGDEDAGGVLAVLVDRSGGSVVLTQTRTPDGERAWMRGTGAEPVPAADADAYVARQVARDPDLWVLEFESDDLTPPFEARVL
ncbi:hypothetical protein AA23498_2785 [Acetobacter nitrogenifigens DSM 23921 = NBRC 105050]|uniref:DUF1491 family protein n=1 Tax=Acetobacter nitrogenifigens DSM 23921 = NBRC 105050 TaxID=1120919 RepID=A0A511XDP9_9PROT|nr:DUF1491 family protein [Acetobacter nitrogenifigens]GBQ96969.1 hypothetical protein AA23498_2785 [Acetobacter nitrogenifigens DSM 23921 = NBRC 105050]GEN61066.1 hypothetical protein ANI02nite_29500 [Acetobacter nitrogenifigens DSM 23921 = NBRC 105050]